MVAWIVTVARNNLDLTRRAVKSFKSQQAGVDSVDTAVRVRVMVVNNGSSDGTASWLHSHREIESLHFTPQRGVAHAWNAALRYLFSLGGTHRVDRALICNSDVVLRSDTYALLAREDAPFVTAVGSGDPRCVMGGGEPRQAARRPHPDFSCFMISRGCWEQVGPFDERYQPAWFEDNKYHIEMHRHGIRAYAIDLPFWHVGGGAQTITRANAIEREKLARAFVANKRRFMEEYGCDPADTASYEKLFTDESFGMYVRVASSAQPHQIG